MITRDARDRLHAGRVAASIAEGTDFTGDEVLGRVDRMRPELTRMQRELWRRLRQAEWSLPRIGRAVRRDHTTILAGLRKLEKVAA